MRDVNYGWLIRYLHTTGASMFFALVYLHTARGLYYGSYKAPRELLWIIGVTILVLMMAKAFFGYTLPSDSRRKAAWLSCLPWGAWHLNHSRGAIAWPSNGRLHGNSALPLP